MDPVIAVIRQNHCLSRLTREINLAWQHANKWAIPHLVYSGRPCFLITSYVDSISNAYLQLANRPHCLKPMFSIIVNRILKC